MIGLDVGKVHTGVARASVAAKLAEPLNSVKTVELDEYLLGMTKKNTIESIVVGLPRNLDGQDTAQTDWVREWAKTVKDKFNVPFYWQDEALTSKQAAASKLSAKKAVDEHALAAAIILQDFLDAPEAERVAC